MNLDIAASWLALGKLKSEDAIAAASSALDRGVYSELTGFASLPATGLVRARTALH